jgi:hypothetical protein
MIGVCDVTNKTDFRIKKQFFRYRKSREQRDSRLPYEKRIWLHGCAKPREIPKVAREILGIFCRPLNLSLCGGAESVLPISFMIYFIQEGATMAVVQKAVNNETEYDIDYEKDPRFVRYMKMRLEKAKEDREAGRLVDADVVFANIRDRHGW